MEISSVSTSLRAVSSSPVRPPPLLKLGGPAINSPCGLASPKSPTAELQKKRRMVMASATTSNSTRQQRDEKVVTWNEKRSHYSLLGVACDAQQEEIRAAYRRLALQYHPDVVPIHQLDTATRLFSEINRAYQTLSDPNERKAYDDLNLITAKAHNGRAAGFSAYPSSPSFYRAGQSTGKNWETDQCWC